MKILVAVDGSAVTKRMLGYVAAHDEWLATDANRFTIIHCALPVPSRAASALGRGVLKDHYAQEVERVFRPIRTFLQKQGIAAEYVSGVGHAAQFIAEHAEEGGFDLLVIGSHGHGALVNLALGSVVTQVIARCKTPTLVIR
jgi:nucleotide-binding universal stress UspA family protein